MRIPSASMIASSRVGYSTSVLEKQKWTHDTIMQYGNTLHSPFATQDISSTSIAAVVDVKFIVRGK
jgi:hypothetical protein